MRDDLLQQFSQKMTEIRRALANVGKPTAFGHAFIWGNIPVKLKNGKTRYYRACIMSVCSDDLEACLKVAESLGIQHAYYNLD